MLNNKKKKYLMANGTIRVTNIFPSGKIRIHNVDIKVAKRKAWSLQLEHMGYVYDSGNTYTAEEAKKRLQADVNAQINKQDPHYRPHNNKCRGEVKIRCGLSMNSGFTQWKTLRKYAEEALEMVRYERKATSGTHIYVLEFTKIIIKLGLTRSAQIIGE